MPKILVVANRTVAGRKLLEKVRERHEQGDAEFVVTVPRTRPQHGSIIYDDFVYQAAQVRIDLARKFLRDQMGLEIVGEVVGALVPALGVRLERAHDDRLELAGEVAAHEYVLDLDADTAPQMRAA